MNAIQFSRFFFLGVLSLPVLGSSKQSIVLNMQYDVEYEVGAIPRSTGWIGLNCTDGVCELLSIKLKRKKGMVKDIFDETWKIERWSANSPVRFAFLNSSLKSGVVAFSYILSGESDGEQRKALDGDAGWQIPWSGPGVRVIAKANEGRRGHSYFLLQADIKQFIFSDGYDEDVPSSVVDWVGDLDGDNKADIIFYTDVNGCDPNTILYLSSRRQDGEVVGKAAEFSHSRQACGC